MTRLTNDMRGEIVTALIHHTFDARVATLCDERAAIATSVYDLHYAKDRKAMDALPDGWLPTNDGVRFRAGATEWTLYFCGVLHGRYGAYSNLACMPSNKRVPQTKRVLERQSGRIVEVFDAQHPIAERVEASAASLDALNEEVNAAKRTAQATLNRFTTVEKLLEEWPEIKPFIPANKQPQAPVPALPTQHLNKMFDLPVEVMV